jgi:hypothetical protein
MKHVLPTFAAVSLLALAGAAAAQSPAQPAATPAPQAPATPQPAERRPLMLELDETSRRQIMSGSRSAETGARGANLPSLGEDARKIDPKLLRGSPYPKDYNDIPSRD